MDLNRKTAYEVLLDMESNQSYSNLALNNFIEKNRPENPAFVRELVYGVLENKLLLDYYLSALVSSGLKKVKKQDLTILRMGVYQIMVMDSVPDYAAINESVVLARKFCRGRDKFINGVLRNFQRRQEELAASLPDRQTDPAKYLSIRYSAASWLVDLWLSAYGLEKTEKLLAASNGRPLLCLRVNQMKSSRAEVMEKLRAVGFETEAGTLSERSILVTGKGTGILEHELFREGWFSVQDEASTLAADTVNPKPGNLVVDVCAAPGGKTMAIAELMDNEGEVFAFDIYDHKLELIQRQADRLGTEIVKTRCQDGRTAREELKGMADCVLADVPCSGLGVIRRKPEIKTKDDAELDFAELVQRQCEILEAASSYVKAGGTLVYSTCTVNPAENEMQVEAFCSRHPEFKLDFMKQLEPDRETDGFFISRMFRV